MNWTTQEREQVRKSGHQWTAIVTQNRRKRHPLRVKIAQLLRRLTAWIEPS